jgi:hypothetical protein
MKARGLRARADDAGCSGEIDFVVFWTRDGLS